MSAYKVILSTSADWEDWICTIRFRANSLGVWNLIDPTNEEPQGLLTEPNRPDTSCLDEPSTSTSPESREDLRLRLEVYKIDLGSYRRQQDNLGQVSLWILDNVSPHWFSILIESRDNPWDMLRILRRKVAPSLGEDWAKVNRDATELDKNPLEDDGVLEWLEKWELIVTRYKPLASNGEVSIRRFLIHRIHPKLGQEWAKDIIDSTAKEKGEDRFFKLVEKTRQHYWRQEMMDRSIP
ncbi:hypothetical protein HDK77DRAFT_302415 [Phyllosticta capitalensis]